MAIAPGVTEQFITVGTLEWLCREAAPESPNGRPPVVFLHGLPAQSYSWRHVMAAVADQGYRAIAPDWIGMGFSSKADKRDFAYTPDAYISALEGLFKTLELSEIFLVVQGFLGSVGLQYAFRHPDQISRLAVFNAPISTRAKLPWKMKQLGLPLVGEMLTQDPLLVDRTLEGGGPYQVDDEDLDVYRRPFLTTSASGRSLFIAVRNLQLPNALEEIEAGFKTWKKPTLIAWGMADPWLPVEPAEQLSNSLPDADLVKLEQVGHFPQEDWHEKVSEALTTFLRRQAL